MATKKQTDAARFNSIYADGFVSAAQYITERICEKKAKRDLPKKFWELPEWKVYFRQQIIAANGLLKIYSPSAIIAALRNPKSYNIYSLRAPHLDQIIQDEEVNIKNAKRKEIVAEEKPQESITFRKEQIKPTNLSKLRDL